MDLDRTSLDQDWLESLDTESVQGRRAVQQDRMVLNDLFEHVPHFGSHALDDAFRRFDVVRQSFFDQLSHHERLEQFERHSLGQAALMQLQRWSDDDNAAARVVDGLAEPSLAGATLLA